MLLKNEQARKLTPFPWWPESILFYNDFHNFYSMVKHLEYSIVKHLEYSLVKHLEYSMVKHLEHLKISY